MEQGKTFFLPMKKIPTTTAQMKRVSVNKAGKPIFYDSPELHDAKNLFLGLLHPHRPELPATGAIRLTTRWMFGTKSDKMHFMPKTTKPDTDNLVKALKDCMTKSGFWVDDAQVFAETTEKYWSSQTPGVVVRIEEEGEEQNV